MQIIMPMKDLRNRAFFIHNSILKSVVFRKGNVHAAALNIPFYLYSTLSLHQTDSYKVLHTRRF